jgi:hypothetical protein
MLVALRCKQISPGPSFSKRGTGKPEFFQWRTCEIPSLVPIFEKGIRGFGSSCMGMLWTMNAS